MTLLTGGGETSIDQALDDTPTTVISGRMASLLRLDQAEVGDTVLFDCEGTVLDKEEWLDDQGLPSVSVTLELSLARTDFPRNLVSAKRMVRGRMVEEDE